MLRVLLTLLVTLFAFPAGAEIEDIALAARPPEAHTTLRLIHRGGPFPHKRDGLIFRNFERRLPAKPRGYYLEYTVRTPGERTRGARRIIAGRGAPGDVRKAEYYYTEDHYQTFWRIRE
jgi:ribonuclease T1